MTITYGEKAGFIFYNEDEFAEMTKMHRRYQEKKKDKISLLNPTYFKKSFINKLFMKNVI